MVNVSNIVCKTVGVAGMSAAIYDAYAMAQHHSSAGALETSADVYEKAVAAERSNTGGSYVTTAMQSKIANLRMNNPIIPILGKVKGFSTGFISSLGENIIPIALSSLALATKGFAQKAGAWGLAIYGVYQIAKEGFGLGKSSAIDK